MNIHIQCIIAGILGVAFHVFIVKLPALKKRSHVANIPFHPAEYFKNDWLGIVGSLLSVVIFVFLLDEVAKFNNKVMDFVKFFFVFVGYAGSSLLQALLSNTNKYINKVVDRKTNIADNKDYLNE